MYQLPQAYNTTDYLQPVDEASIRIVTNEVDLTFPTETCESDIFELCITLMAEHGWHAPVIVSDAVTLYDNLRRAIHAIL